MFCSLIDQLLLYWCLPTNHCRGPGLNQPCSGQWSFLQSQSLYSILLLDKLMLRNPTASPCSCSCQWWNCILYTQTTALQFLAGKLGTDHTQGHPVGRSLGLSFSYNYSSEQRQDRRGSDSVLHHMRQTRWATFYVNGLLTARKRRCLELDLLRYNIDISCVQESHMRGTRRVDFGKEHTLLYSGS